MTAPALHPRGVFCAAATPLTADYAPDHTLFVAHAKRLIEQGCDGVALLGTTGEATSTLTVSVVTGEIRLEATDE